MHDDLNLTQNCDPCLSMSVVCRVCAGFDLAKKLRFTIVFIFNTIEATNYRKKYQQL